MLKYANNTKNPYHLGVLYHFGYILDHDPYHHYYLLLGFHYVLFHDGHYCSGHLHHTRFYGIFCQPIHAASGYSDFEATLYRLFLIMILI